MIAPVSSTSPSVRNATDEAAAKLRLEAAKPAPIAPSNAAGEAAAVVSISKQGADKAIASPEAVPALKSNKPALAYEAADTDLNGKISTYEKQSYDFRHPQVETYKALTDTPDPQ